MKRILGFSAAVLLLAMPAAAQKVTIDYAHDFDFDGVETFQYVDTPESNSADPLMNGRIEAAIKRELREGGLTEVTEDPDIYVTFHITSKDKTVYNTTNFGYGGYGAGWRGWGMGMGSSTTTASSYTEGTLILDGYTATDKKMVWRGTGTVTVGASPEKRTKQVDKILAKLGQRWDKILANQGK